MIRTLIVDDEPLMRAGLHALLREDDDLEVVGECGNGQDALHLVRDRNPDLILLDIEMPELDGLGLLRSLPRPQWPAIIFVTAHDAFAVDAFEHDAVDYLLKPFGDGRAREAIQRAKRRVAGMRTTTGQVDSGTTAGHVTGAESAAYLRRLAYRDGERIAFIAVAEIDWIEAVGDYVRIHAGALRPLVRARLHELATQLDPAHFLRVHRSCVLNLGRLRELRPLSHGDYEARLETGDRVRVSRTYRAELARRTGNYF